jgi:hypothetical protein
MLLLLGEGVAITLTLGPEHVEVYTAGAQGIAAIAGASGLGLAFGVVSPASMDTTVY